MNEGTTSGHDFLIILIIVCIVALQGWVFYKAYLKINIFKSILPEAKSFKTIKIYVREDKIEGLDLEDVYANLDKYKKNKSQEIGATDTVIETIDTKVTQESITEKYYKMPNNIDVFDVECQSIDQGMYQLSISSQFPDYAEFELINGDEVNVGKFLTQPTLFLDRACVYDGIIPDEVKSIEVIKKGTAMLTDGLWKVEDPCKIVFHS